MPVIGSSGIFAWTSQPLISHPTIVIGRKGSAGKPWLIKGPSHPSDTTFYLEPREGANVDLDFLYYVLSHAQPEASDDVIPSLQRHQLEALELPLPPPTEQRAIAAVLSNIQAAAETQGKMVAAFKELKAATLAGLFQEGLRQERTVESGIGRMPASWRMSTLGEIAKIGNGSTPRRTNPAYWDGGTIPWLTSAKVHEIIIQKADEYVTELAKKECHLPMVPAGSVVIAITGQGKTLGNAALLAFPSCVSQHLAFLRLQSSDVLPEFVLRYLQYQYHHLRQAANAGGTTKGALTCSFFESYPIPLPEVQEQREIAAIMKALDAAMVIAKNKRGSLEALFSSALNLLMTGQVRIPPGASFERFLVGDAAPEVVRGAKQ